MLLIFIINFARRSVKLFILCVIFFYIVIAVCGAYPLKPPICPLKKHFCLTYKKPVHLKIHRLQLCSKYQYSAQAEMFTSSIGLLINALIYAEANRTFVSKGTLWSIAERRMR